MFADFCESSVWAISIADGAVEFRDLELPASDVVGIVSDGDGELLVLSLSGQVSRIVAG